MVFFRHRSNFESLKNGGCYEKVKIITRNGAYSALSCLYSLSYGICTNLNNDIYEIKKITRQMKKDVPKADILFYFSYFLNPVLNDFYYIFLSPDSAMFKH
jgi:hypothetical protein